MSSAADERGATFAQAKSVTLSKVRRNELLGVILDRQTVDLIQSKDRSNNEQ